MTHVIDQPHPGVLEGKHMRFLMRNAVLFLSIVSMMSSVSLAFPSASARGTILELLNGKAQKHQLLNSHPVSFDEIICRRNAKSCILSMRFMIPQDDFFIFRKGSCVVEPVQSIYDILDDKSGDLTEYFVKSVNECL